MRLGIMQGRLSPPQERSQSFPSDSWQEELARAKSFGFELMEWLFTAADYERNPIWSREGVAIVRERVKASGLRVESICADYFVSHALVRMRDSERRQHIQVLNALIGRAAELGIRVIVVPALEDGDVYSPDDMAALVAALRGSLSLAKAEGVVLALESNMPADRYLRLVRAAPLLGICFDTGNRTAAGLDIVSDIARLASYVKVVHIKDRLPGGPNVPLGTGAAPLDAFFAALVDAAYSGPVILETTVGEDYAAHARRNLDFVRSRLNSR
jgi:sugar phosphate isomerase/epimerase